MSSTKVSTGQIADAAITTEKINDDAVTSDKILDGAITAAKIATGVIPAFSAVRQTVQGGPTKLDAAATYAKEAAVPDFWPAATYSPSVTSLNLSTSGVSSTVPFVVSASQGFGNAAERVGISTANLTWTALTASNTNYLYVDVAADGVLTTGASLTAPTYNQYATTGTNTFSISTMTMFSTGTTKVWRVFVGEAVTGVSTVTSVVHYAYNGVYDTGNYPSGASMVVATPYAFNHNIGARAKSETSFYCSTIDGAFNVGDEIFNNPIYLNSSVSGDPVVLTGTKTGQGICAPVGAVLYFPIKTTGAYHLGTVARWKMRTVVRRAF